MISQIVIKSYTMLCREDSPPQSAAASMVGQLDEILVPTHGLLHEKCYLNVLFYPYISCNYKGQYGHMW